MAKIINKSVVHLTKPTGGAVFCGAALDSIHKTIYRIHIVDHEWDPNWDKEYRRCTKCWNNPKALLQLLARTEL